MRFRFFFLFAVLATGIANGSDDDQEVSHIRSGKKQGGVKSCCGHQGACDMPLPGPDDLNVRFNKISFPNAAPNDWVLLQAKDYPVGGSIANTLKTKSTGVSIVTAEDFELHGARAMNYMTSIGGPPSMPSSDPDNEFWADFRHVVKVQLRCSKDRLTGPNALTRFPDQWSSLSIHEIAEAVHDEYPGYHQVKLLERLFAEGVQIDTDIFPFRSNKDFIGLQVRLAALNTWAIGVVAPVSFHVKWYTGRPRPEEVAWKIATGELTAAHGVPEDIIYDVWSMHLHNAANFTAYREGCPRHPSWPAMHSAASSASLWLPVVLKDMTPEQYCEALRVDYGVSYARTVAGVHYPTDNIAGLNLGKEVMLDRLADHLAETCGSNRTAVQEKLERFAFDWAKFDPETCTIN